MNRMFQVKEEIKTADYGKLSVEPLEQGYGQTLGNALRRILLTSLPGAAVTMVKIEGVRHQFTTLTGVKEDIVELILNIKKLRVHIDGDEEVTLKLSRSGKTEVYARDIELPAGVTIANPDLYIASLADKKSSLEITMVAKKGYGYEVAAEKEVSTIGYIPVDSLYSPVVRVNYKVEETRVGRMTNLDKLVMEIWTDGTISPKEALEESARIAANYFAQFYAPHEEEAVAVVESTVKVPGEVSDMRIEELDIPTRIVNALENGGITTVGQLLTAPKSDLSKIKNLGSKSLSIIEKKLEERGISVTVPTL